MPFDIALVRFETRPVSGRTTAAEMYARRRRGRSRDHLGRAGEPPRPPSRARDGGERPMACLRRATNLVTGVGRSLHRGDHGSTRPAVRCHGRSKVWARRETVGAHRLHRRSRVSVQIAGLNAYGERRRRHRHRSVRRRSDFQTRVSALPRTWIDGIVELPGGDDVGLATTLRGDTGSMGSDGAADRRRTTSPRWSIPKRVGQMPATPRAVLRWAGRHRSESTAASGRPGIPDMVDDGCSCSTQRDPRGRCRVRTPARAACFSHAADASDLRQSPSP